LCFLKIKTTSNFLNRNFHPAPRKVNPYTLWQNSWSDLLYSLTASGGNWFLELLGVLQHEGAALREQRDRLSQLKSTGANF
jgi:hypothetical protein